MARHRCPSPRGRALADLAGRRLGAILGATRPGPGWVPAAPAAEPPPAGFSGEPAGENVGESAGVAAEPAASPGPVRRARLDLPAVLALALVCVTALAAAAVYLWRAGPRELPAPASRPAAATPTLEPGRADEARPAGLTTPTPALWVDVQGKVARPGVVRLSPGARVLDALAAAGGVLPGTDTVNLNLARPLVDGEQVLVGLPGTPAPGGALGGPGARVGPGAAAAPVDLNTATAEQLQTLPGIGPVLAERILSWRAQAGRFRSVDQLREVPGIGERRFAELRPRVRV